MHVLEEIHDDWDTLKYDGEHDPELHEETLHHLEHEQDEMHHKIKHRMKDVEHEIEEHEKHEHEREE